MNEDIRRARRGPALGLGATLLIAFAAIQARAADPERVLAAQALYDQATAEMEAKDYPSACSKLEEVTRLVPEGLGAKLTLGQVSGAVLAAGVVLVTVPQSNETPQSLEKRKRGARPDHSAAQVSLGLGGVLIHGSW